MRFYSGAHEYLHKVGLNHSDRFDQCLYLVPEMGNPYDANAVMLHNGKQKLGSVEATAAHKIRQILNKWKTENGSLGEDVIVVRMQQHNDSLQYYKQRGNISVRSMHRVNERLARKFSNKNRKD